MKRVAVFSDTHGNLDRLPAAIRLAGEVDAFFHLGDYASDAKGIAALLPVPYHAVRGNCDFYGADAPARLVVPFEGASLLLVHGDAYRDTYSLARAAEEMHCAAVLFGHTHTPLLTASGPVLIVNPGSLSKPRYGNAASFAIITINGNDVDAKIITL